MTRIIFPTLDEIRGLIHSRPRSVELEDIAIGAEVSESWLKKFLAGKIEQPSYLKIVAVYLYLIEKNTADITIAG